MSEARQAAQAAKAASVKMAVASEAQRNQALAAMAQALDEKWEAIVAANAKDVKAAREEGTPDPLIDRLMLDRGRVHDMAQALESLAQLPDPTGHVLEERVLPNGLEITRVSVPLGVVAMIYEARPNVTADAAGICIKSGNACVLRGGSLAAHSNRTIAAILHDAAVSAGMPANCIVAIESTDRAETDELLGLRGLVDVLIPRGGAGLIAHCVEHATVPVIETGTGNCHLYVHEDADLAKAVPILINAKTQRVGVCNAVESLLVDRAVAQQALPVLLQALDQAGVAIHGDEAVLAAADPLGIPALEATEDDWGREYLDLDISVKVVEDEAQAIEHINRFGTRHSEAIVTENPAAAELFLASVDASAVYVNASTRFTDGGQFGLGAEIGISTQKLHARGPFALEALTTYKYLVRGTGQVRA